MRVVESVMYSATANAYSFGLHDFRSQVGQRVDAQAALAARNGHQNVLRLEHLHLLERPPRDQRVHFACNISDAHYIMLYTLICIKHY